jgi:hypothetical protein
MTKQQFIEGMDSWSSHLPLLWEALEATQGEVIELGIGFGSTPKLHEYCKEKKRSLFSYENNIEWYRKFEHLRTSTHAIEFTQNWMEPIERHRYSVGLVFSDESPGEIRKYNIAMFCNTAQIIVAHDSEKENRVGYRYDLVTPLFKYHVNVSHIPGPDAAAFSNFVDVTKWSV